MRKRIVNHHKLIKTFDRTADKTERFFDKLFKKNGPRKKKDFTWKGPQYNPFIKEEKLHKGKLLLKIGTLIVSVVLLIYVVVFSRLFDITNISISGNKKISTAEIEGVIKNTLEYQSYGFIPNSSFFVANIDDIREVLKRRFPIDEIRIEKRFPHDLSIMLTEKISTIVYDNGSVYGLIGLDGSVIELIRAVENYEWKDVVGKMVTTTLDGTTTTVDVVSDRVHTPDTKKILDQAGEYPVIYDKRAHQTDKGLIVLRPEEVALLIAWYNEVKNLSFGVNSIIIENDLDFLIQTKEGWTIKSRFARNNAEEQVRELKLALPKIENTKKLSYIDLRYENRMYWK